MNSSKFEEYLEYWNETIPRVIEAEETIREIKGSYMWRRVSNYFKVLYNRGYLKENPCRNNDYKVEVGCNMVDLEEIADILTPEQLAAIKKLTH